MAEPVELWDAFAAGWARASDRPPPATPPPEATQAALEGPAAWPSVELPHAVWGTALGRAAAQGSIEAADLFLATACVHGSVGAAASFEDRFGAEVDAALRARDGSDPAAADLRQAARERLLVGLAGARPKLADYHGTGPLLHWLRVVSVRFRIDAGRRRQTAPQTDLQGSNSGLAADDLADDPEMAYLKSHYRTLMQSAFAEAVASLQPRERLVLRFAVAERLSTERIGAAFGVHPATARRWVAAAREHLWSATRREIMRRLGIRTAEFDSIVRLVRSELDLSVVRLLASPED